VTPLALAATLLLVLGLIAGSSHWLPAQWSSAGPPIRWSLPATVSSALVRPRRCRPLPRSSVSRSP
jgi:hypothetical protein